MIWLYLTAAYFVGVGVAVLIMRPMKSWQEGYDAAKKMYSDWNKGFDQGFEAAQNHFTDYSLGYKNGWTARDLICKEESDGGSD